MARCQAPKHSYPVKDNLPCNLGYQQDLGVVLSSTLNWFLAAHMYDSLAERVLGA